MAIWAPVNNQISYNEGLEEKITNTRFWIEFLNESDEEKRELMFENWEDPLPDRDEFVAGNVTNMNDEAYGTQDEIKFQKRKDSWDEDPRKMRDYKMGIAMEAK